jgi:hypothetical protein
MRSRRNIMELNNTKIGWIPSKVSVIKDLLLKIV